MSLTLAQQAKHVTQLLGGPVCRGRGLRHPYIPGPIKKALQYLGKAHLGQVAPYPLGVKVLMTGGEGYYGASEPVKVTVAQAGPGQFFGVLRNKVGMIDGDRQGEALPVTFQLPRAEPSRGAADGRRRPREAPTPTAAPATLPLWPGGSGEGGREAGIDLLPIGCGDCPVADAADLLAQPHPQALPALRRVDRPAR